MTKWIRAVAIDSAVLGLLYAGLVLGIDGAWNVFAAIFWVITPMALLFLNDSALKTLEKRPAGFSGYNIATDLAMVAILAWFGHVWMASLKLIALFLVEDGYKTEMARREKAA